MFAIQLETRGAGFMTATGTSTRVFFVFTPKNYNKNVLYDLIKHI